MKRKVLVAALLAVCALVVLPGAAFAKAGAIYYHGVQPVYFVPVGANLKVDGSVTGNKSQAHWRSMTFEVEMLKGKKWADVIHFAPRRDGTFTFYLKKPVVGTYRVHFDGDNRYGKASDVFMIKRPATLLDPLLSVDTPVEAIGLGPTSANRPPARSVETDSISVWLLEAQIHTGLTAAQMAGNHLHITVLGSTSQTQNDADATYSVVWPDPIEFPSPPFPSSDATSFGGSNEVTIGPLPCIRYDTSHTWFYRFKFRAEWDGNQFTKPGSAESLPWHALD